MTEEVKPYPNCCNELTCKHYPCDNCDELTYRFTPICDCCSGRYCRKCWDEGKHYIDSDY